MKNPHFFAEFDRRCGPLTPVHGVRGAGDGVIRQLFRMPDGKLVRYRGNRDRTLVTQAVESEDVFDVDSKLIIEGPQDFIGFAMPGADGTVDCYLIPNDRAIADLKECHRRCVEKSNVRSHVRALFFYGEVEMHDQPYYGWQHIYAEFRLPERAAAPAPTGTAAKPTAIAVTPQTNDALAALVAKFRRKLIKMLGGERTGMVVHVTVDATGTGGLQFHL